MGSASSSSLINCQISFRIHCLREMLRLSEDKWSRLKYEKLEARRFRSFGDTFTFGSIDFFLLLFCILHPIKWRAKGVITLRFKGIPGGQIMMSSLDAIPFSFPIS